MNGQKVHYVCLVCKGVSDTPHECRTEGCSLHGKPLAECNCTDGEHFSAIPPEEQRDETNSPGKP